MVSTPSFAIFNAVQSKHIAECVVWLITDPITHALNCLPSRVPPQNGTISPLTGGPVITEAPPMSIPDECDWEYKIYSEEGGCSCHSEEAR